MSIETGTEAAAMTTEHTTTQKSKEGMALLVAFQRFFTWPGIGWLRTTEDEQLYRKS